MSEGLMDALLLAAAFAASLAGMGWLHWQGRALGAGARRHAPARWQGQLPRWLGASGLAASLGLCLAVDHASMASLVSIMTLAAAALAVPSP